MRVVKSGEWKKYRVTKKKFFSGELKDYLVEGMEFEFNGAKLRIDNQEIIAPHFRGVLRKGWAIELSPEEALEPEPAPERESFVDRSLAAKQKSINVLPDGWSGMHWKNKVQAIREMAQGDLELLTNIRRTESRAVKAEAEARIEELQAAIAEEEAQAAAQVVAPKVKPPRRGIPPYIDAELDGQLAAAVGAEVTPRGESEDAASSDEV